jgi:phosphoadenosine phosphosulfate reductase
MQSVEHIIETLEALSAEEGLTWASKHFQNPQFSSALGEEDQVITYLIAQQRLSIGIFTLDTGRLFSETYDLLSLTQQKYGRIINVFFPEAKAVEEYVNTHGINGFYNSVENRKSCCNIRKVQSLKRALSGADLWITGLRAGQSANRQQMKKVEWDQSMGLLKYNPILDWSTEHMRDFIKEHSIPVNTLHKKGFESIGCAPCTRAIAPGEDARAGRWWWETSAKECGLHQTNVTVTSEH